MNRTKDASLSTPPGSTVIGDAYIVNPTGSGGWAGKDRAIARALATDGSQWSYQPAKIGDRVHDETTGLEWVFDGTNWLGIISPFHSDHRPRNSTKIQVGVDGQSEGINILSAPRGTNRKLLITRAFVGHAVATAATSRPRYSVGGSGTDFGDAQSFAVGDSSYEWFGSLVSPLASIAGVAEATSLAFGFNCSAGTLNGDYHTIEVDGWIVEVM
jgi:hypothetical protein